MGTYTPTQIPNAGHNLRHFDFIKKFEDNQTDTALPHKYLSNDSVAETVIFGLRFSDGWRRKYYVC